MGLNSVTCEVNLVACTWHSKAVLQESKMKRAVFIKCLFCNSGSEDHSVRQGGHQDFGHRDEPRGTDLRGQRQRPPAAFGEERLRGLHESGHR